MKTAEKKPRACTVKAQKRESIFSDHIRWGYRPDQLAAKYSVSIETVNQILSVKKRMSGTLELLK